MFIMAFQKASPSFAAARRRTMRKLTIMFAAIALLLLGAASRRRGTPGSCLEWAATLEQRRRCMQPHSANRGFPAPHLIISALNHAGAAPRCVQGAAFTEAPARAHSQVRSTSRMRNPPPRHVRHDARFRLRAAATLCAAVRVSSFVFRIVTARASLCAAPTDADGSLAA